MNLLSMPLTLCFLPGALITIAEPDLQVLARQVPSIPNNTLIFSVAGGVGLFLAIALIRTVFSIRLSHMLLITYALTFLTAALIPDVFIPVSFDSGGVTTGPITVPFIMAMGIGLTSLRSDKNSQSDSFGLIALCSVGSILAVLILGVFFAPEDAGGSAIKIVEIATTKEAFHNMLHALPEYAIEVAKAMLPIAGVFALFQIMHTATKAGAARCELLPPLRRPDSTARWSRLESCVTFLAKHISDLTTLTAIDSSRQGLCLRT